MWAAATEVLACRIQNEWHEPDGIAHVLDRYPRLVVLSSGWFKTSSREGCRTHAPNERLDMLLLVLWMELAKPLFSDVVRDPPTRFGDIRTR